MPLLLALDEEPLDAEPVAAEPVEEEPLDDDGVSACAPDAASARATHNETKKTTRFITLTSRTST
jgi:hypothetical protein